MPKQTGLQKPKNNKFSIGKNFEIIIKNKNYDNEDDDFYFPEDYEEKIQNRRSIISHKPTNMFFTKKIIDFLN